MGWLVPDEETCQRRFERYNRNAKTIARCNGRMLLYLMTPLILISPIIALDGRAWHFLIAIPLAIANVILCRRVIRWGQQHPI